MKKIIMLLSTLMFVSLSHAQATLELFGQPLKNATRPQLRDAIKKAGVQQKRENDLYWVDEYNPSDVLEGASGLAVGYVSATNRFAFAEYTFSTFMDTGLVGKVIKMVSNKYGPPSSEQGDMGLGPVNAHWNLPQGMRIEVKRGWPDTTTYLDYKDVSAYQQMSAEIDKQKNAVEKQQQQNQNQAF
jgi:hypothetical protein